MFFIGSCGTFHQADAQADMFASGADLNDLVRFVFGSGIEIIQTGPVAQLVHHDPVKSILPVGENAGGNDRQNRFFPGGVDSDLERRPSQSAFVDVIADGLFEVQVVSRYDNENSFTSNMVRTIKYFAELG